MSALADALAQAQTRAVAALGKQYVGGTLDSDAVRIALDSVGLTDPADTERWLAALDILRETGSSAPAEAAQRNGDAPASDAQWTLIRKLADERKLVAPEGPLTKVQAHEVIDTLKAGTYDADKWAVPF